MAAILIAAQWGALMHAFEHDAGKPKTQACATCVAASQLGFASIDTSTITEGTPSYWLLNTEPANEFHSLYVPVARQRGPPITL